MNQWKKGIAHWRVGNTLYISVPFTWLMADAEALATEYPNLKTLIGGPGTGQPSQLPEFTPLIHHNPLATFTTRGCPNGCRYCAVPKIEPEFYEVKDFRPAPVICDNNLLAATRKHIVKVIDASKRFRFVDFNQGLEAGRWTADLARLFGQLKCKIRFSLDRPGDADKVIRAIEMTRKHTTKDIGIYVLVGFEDNISQAVEKLELIRSWGIRPTPMRFQKLDAKKKNELCEGWEERDMLDLMKYYSRLRYLEKWSFSEWRDYYCNIRTSGQIEMDLTHHEK